jgi:LysM repeat protein
MTYVKALQITTLTLLSLVVLPHCSWLNISTLQAQSTLDKHTVKSGDTLYGIAIKYKLTVSELKNLNELRTNTINPGQVLIIRSSTTSEVISSDEDLTPQGRFIAHKMVGGESYKDLLEVYQMTDKGFLLLNPGIVKEALIRGSIVNVLAPPDTLFPDPYIVERKADSTLKKIPFFRYQPDQKGSVLRSGQLYNPQSLTVAFDQIPLGSLIRLRNKENGIELTALVNDRMNGLGIRLSDAVFSTLYLTKDAEIAVVEND